MVCFQICLEVASVSMDNRNGRGGLDRLRLLAPPCVPELLHLIDLRRFEANFQEVRKIGPVDTCSTVDSSLEQPINQRVDIRAKAHRFEVVHHLLSIVFFHICMEVASVSIDSRMVLAVRRSPPPFELYERWFFYVFDFFSWMYLSV